MKIEQISDLNLVSILSGTYSANIKLPATKIQINEGAQRINVFLKMVIIECLTFTKKIRFLSNGMIIVTNRKIKFGKNG